MDVTRSDIRTLVNRPITQHRVTSVYLNTDGARYPRPADYLARLDGLLRQAREAVEQMGGAARQGVEADCATIDRWVRDEFVRDGVKGIGIFSSAGEIIDIVQAAEPFRNLVRVGDRPYVVPLEAMLGRHHHIGLALIERGTARLFRYRLGRIVELTEVTSDVPGQHDQGGWSQARFQRSIEDDVLHHFKEAADSFRRVHEDDPLDALVLAGPQSEVMEFRRTLHPYVEKVVHGDPVSLPSTPSHEQLMDVFARTEQDLVSTRRRELLARLKAGAGQAERVARGIRHVLEAANAHRIDVLFVVEGVGQPGFRSATGALALHADEAEAYGTPIEPVDDLIDELIELCVRTGAHIELFRDDERLDGVPVAAILRF